jgi:hypothetical protein
LNRTVWNDLIEKAKTHTKGCRANRIRRERSGWFHGFKAHASFRGVKMFNNTMCGCMSGWVGCVVPNYCVCRGVSVCGRNQDARK